jgi:hypothetical protein
MSYEPERAETRDTPASPYLKLPVAVVAGVLALLLLGLFGFGMYANANLRPQGTIVPTPGPPTAVPAAAAVTTTVAPAPVAAATATSAPAATATRQSVTATSLPRSPIPTATTTAQTVSATQVTPTATVDPQLQAEVEDAYKTYWDVRAQALFNLDTSHLPEVMAGDHLAAIQDLIAQLRAEGHAIQTSVQHNYVVSQASNEHATVVDEYVDNSVYIDPTSHIELSEPKGTTVREQYEINKIGGTWRVVSLVRASQ